MIEIGVIYVGAFTGVQQYFSEPLPEVAKRFHYSEANILILEGKERELRNNYPEIYENLSSCKHHADCRTPFEYGQDLVASWLFEDDFLDLMRSSTNISVNLDGADKNREILPNTKISTDSDYRLILPNGDKRKLELMSDYTGFWARKGKLHLRDEKYTKLKKSNSLFVAVSVTTKKFALYDFSLHIEADYIPSHKPYGGKPACEIKITSDMMKSYISNKLVSEIEKALGI